MEGFGTGGQVSPWNRWLLCRTGGHEQHAALSPAHRLLILTLIKRAIVTFLLRTCCLLNWYCGNYGSCVCIYLWTLQSALYVCIFLSCFFFFCCFFLTVQIKINLDTFLMEVSSMIQLLHLWWKLGPVFIVIRRGDEQLPAALWWPSAPAKPHPSHSPEGFHVAWLQENLLSWALLRTASLELLVPCREN